MVHRSGPEIDRIIDGSPNVPALHHRSARSSPHWGFGEAVAQTATQRARNQIIYDCIEPQLVKMRTVLEE